MPKLCEILPLPGLRLFLRYEDGVEGEVDVSDMAGKGVFTLWDDPKIFGQVAISPESGAPTWPGEIDICPDALYWELTGTMPSEVNSGADSETRSL